MKIQFLSVFIFLSIAPLAQSEEHRHEVCIDNASQSHHIIEQFKSIEKKGHNLYQLFCENGKITETCFMLQPARKSFKLLIVENSDDQRTSKHFDVKLCKRQGSLLVKIEYWGTHEITITPRTTHLIIDGAFRGDFIHPHRVATITDLLLTVNRSTTIAHVHEIIHNTHHHEVAK